jgi:hypothetical protein
VFETGVTPIPVSTYDVGGEKITIFTGTVIVNDKLVIGNPPDYPTTLGTAYSFPTSIGLLDQVLTPDVSMNMLEWEAQTGTVLNGGQSGAVTIGTTTANDLTLISSGGIHIGDSSTDDIHLQGGVRYQYNAIADTDPPGGNTFDLELSHYFVEITGSGITTVRLPDADGAVAGHMYIISKGYTGGALAIKSAPASGDTIDGLAQINLTYKDQRLKVISSGTDRWLIL